VTSNRHLFRPFLFGLAFLVAAPAVATPPPVRIAVVVVSADPEAKALGEAYVAYLSEKGLFSRATLAAPTHELWGCVREKKEQAGCARRAADWKSGGAAVVLFVSGQRHQAWECVGVGGKPARPADQTVSIDVRSGLFGREADRIRLRRLAAACVIAAGSESGW
jgi:hypothetical protein